MRGAPRVQIGEIFELQRRKVDVIGNAKYREIGIRSFGRGIFHKDELFGFELGDKRVFEIRPRDLLLSNVFAWEGAVAVAGEPEAGLIGSHRFMTWTTDQTDVDAHYVASFLTSEAGIRMLREASPGSAGRNKTLAISAFKRLEIPLPTLTEQRRIVSQITSAQAAVREATERQTHADILVTQMERQILNPLLLGGVPLKDLAVINPKPSRLDPNDKVLFAPMAALSAEAGQLSGGEIRVASDVGSGYKQFLRGDIVFARITPSMQNGKSAVFNDPVIGVGFGTTEFHVIRPNLTSSANFIHAILRTLWFRGLAMKSFTGTAGQQRVPASFMREIKIPDVRRPEVRAAVHKLTELESKRRALAALYSSRHQLADALPKALRNAIFSELG